VFNRKRILFVTQRPSDFYEIKRAVEFFTSEGYECFMLCVFSPYNDNVFSLVLKKILIEKSLIKIFIQIDGFIEEFSEKNYFKTQKNKKKNKRFFIKNSKLYFFLKRFKMIVFISALEKFKYRIKNIIKKRVRLIKSLFFIIALFFKNRKNYRKLLSHLNINIIILPEDIVGLVTPVMIAAGHHYNIPSLILPYTIANQEEAFQSLKNQPHYSLQLFSNKLTGFIFRKWIMKKEGHSVLRLPAPYVYGHLLTRTVPPDPWMMNSGYANLIAVESEKMYEYYLKAGIPKSKMQVVGALYDDYLARYSLNKIREREKIYYQLNLPPDKPLFFIGGFPNQLSAIVPRFDFQDIFGFVSFIVETLSCLKEQYHIIFRPHPNYLELSKLFEKQGILPTLMPTDLLVSVADVYLAFASATIRWAIACGLPVINYDVFYYQYTDYKNVPSVLHANTKEEFILAVYSIKNEVKLRELQALAHKEKNKWGYLDGKSSERINHLVQKLCNLKKVKRTAV